ncbi:Autotransporter domain-containing protein [Pseudomonas marincola]|uniref:Autotransporter domain-containing protein n=1 Tax=Pseudomonas marincola TaxID=437900 RepID=A0A653DYM1_9PSED|nr:autotransporter outer membrane beta-barrel domain-containing protein [Pseudomonas marincola]CAE6935946.1 Autotransporter domain-containing protein [Pseudomonas marincola]
MNILRPSVVSKPAANLKLIAVAIALAVSGVSQVAVAGSCTTSSAGSWTCSGAADPTTDSFIHISESGSLDLMMEDDFGLNVDTPEAAILGVVTPGSTGDLVITQGTGTITQNGTGTAVGGRNEGTGNVIMNIGAQGDTGTSGSLYADAQGGGDITLNVYKSVSSKGYNAISASTTANGNINIYAAEDIDAMNTNSNSSRGILATADEGNVDIKADGNVSGQAGGVYVTGGKDVNIDINGDVTSGVTSLATAGVGVANNTGSTSVNVQGDVTSHTDDGVMLYAHSGAGSQSVHVGGDVTATDGGGVAVTSTGSSEAINIAVDGNVTANDFTHGGIYAFQDNGSGDIHATVGGDVTTTDGRGFTLYADRGGDVTAHIDGDINAKTDGVYAVSNNKDSSAHGDVNVSVGGDINAGRHGIRATSNGSVNVQLGGNVTAGDALGISATSTDQGSEGGITIEAMGDVTSGTSSNANPEWTIYADNQGTADSYIRTQGDVTGGDVGIKANSGGDVVVDAHGLISGDSGVAVDMTGVSGASTLMLSDNWALSGQAQAGNGTNDVLQLAGNTDSALDLSTVGDTGNANGIIGFENLLKTDSATWTLSGEQTQGGFDSVTLQNGTTVLNNATLLATGSPVDIQQAATLQTNGSSTINGSVNNSGTMSFDSTQPGSTLTINGNYTGNNGLLHFNTVLDDDNSQTDKLVVQGDTAGTTNVAVTNAGGTGASTLNGIELIDVGGQSNGEFVQQGRIAAGAYDYSLVRGQGGNANNWYLSSQVADPIAPLTPTVPPSTPEPGTPLTPTVPPVITEPSTPPAQPEMILRPEGASYSANLAAANTLFAMDMHDRIGSSTYVDPTTGEHKRSKLWLRTEDGHGHFNDSSEQLRTHNDHTVVQLGADLFGGSFNGTDKWEAGLMAGYGTSESESHSKITGYSSKGEVSGYSVGGYATWFANANEQTGAYVDTWAQYGWFDNRVKGDGLQAEHYDSSGLTASIESGYTFKLEGEQHDYFVQPQAQLIYMGVTADNHTEHNGTRVRDAQDKNVQTRLGARASMRSKIKQGLEPFVEVNWLHNSNEFGSSLDGVTVSQDGARNIGEMSLGLSGKVGKNVEVWGKMTQQIGEDDYRDSAATVGLKVNF